MTKGFKRTAEGVVLTWGAAKAVGGLLAFLGLLVVMGWSTNQKIQDAIPRREFEDTTRALRGDLTTTMARVDTTSFNMLAMSCEQRGYPMPWCRDIPRVQQAGRP